MAVVTLRQMICTCTATNGGLVVMEGIAVSTATAHRASIVHLPLLYSVSTAARLVGRDYRGNVTVEGPSGDRIFRALSTYRACIWMRIHSDCGYSILHCVKLRYIFNTFKRICVPVRRIRWNLISTFECRWTSGTRSVATR